MLALLLLALLTPLSLAQITRCPNPTPTTYVFASTTYQYEWCMAYLSPDSVNFSPGSLEGCAAACNGSCIGFNYADANNCRTATAVTAMTTSFYGWSAFSLVNRIAPPTPSSSIRSLSSSSFGYPFSTTTTYTTYTSTPWSPSFQSSYTSFRVSSTPPVSSTSYFSPVYSSSSRPLAVASSSTSWSPSFQSSYTSLRPSTTTTTTTTTTPSSSSSRYYSSSLSSSYVFSIPSSAPLSSSSSPTAQYSSPAGSSTSSVDLASSSPVLIIEGPSSTSTVPAPVATDIACPASNGTVYSDNTGTQYRLFCSFDLWDPAPELRTVQPSFQSCIDDCDQRFAGECPGVTWVSSGRERTWCYQKPATAILRSANASFWSAIKIPGPEGVTCPESNGTVYTDAIYFDALGDQYLIECSVNLVDSSSGLVTVQSSFQDCLNDCHRDDDCEGVTWRPNGDMRQNCYHKSRNAYAERLGASYWSAKKINELDDIDSGPSSPSAVASSISSSAAVSSTSLPGSNTSAFTTATSSPPPSAPIGSPFNTIYSSISPPSPSSTLALSCPRSNGTIWTDILSNPYQVLCGYDTSGGVSAVSQQQSLEACINACDTNLNGTCGAVAFLGSYCYHKPQQSSVAVYPANSDLWSAVRV